MATTNWPRKRACATREAGPGELAERSLGQERKKPSIRYTNLPPPGPGQLAVLNIEWAATATGHILAVIEGGSS